MEKPLANVKTLFDHVLEIESLAERNAYLNEACAGTPELRQKVEALLKAYHFRAPQRQMAEAGRTPARRFSGCRGTGDYPTAGPPRNSRHRRCETRSTAQTG